MNKIAVLLKASTLRRVAWMTLTYFARFGFQGIAFALIARALGTEGFGAFSATLSLAVFLSPFVELGAYTLIIRDITAKVPISTVVGYNLGLIAWSLPIGLLLASVFKIFLLPNISWELFLPTILAIFLGGRLSTIASAVNVATGLVWRNTITETLGGLLQAALALILFLIKGSAEIWSLMYMFQYVVVGLGAFSWVTVGHRLDLRFPQGKRITEGLSFATANSASGAYSELDKTLLQRFSDLNSTGIYAAGFRIIVLASVPMVALLATVAPRFFERGAKSPREALTYSFFIARLTAVYGVFAFLVLWLVADFVPVILGSDFTQSSNVVRTLGVYVLLQGMQYPLADALTASGFQNIRTIGQVFGLVLNVGLNTYLIPRYNWHGAATSALVTQLSLWVFFGIAWWLLLQNKRTKKDI